MTEKRFLLTEQFNGLQGVPFVKDDCADVDTYYTVDGTVDLLNELSEENEKLKKDCSNLIEDNTEYVAEINQMHKENEELKKEIKAKDKIIELYYVMVKE